MKRKAFFYVQEKNMSGEDDDYFSSIGNMYSGSYDPEEQNRALEREAERRRREQEREQARILREQQAAQAEQQKNLQKPPPQAVDIDNTKPAPVFKTDPDDPYKGLDASRRNDMLMNRFSAGNDPKSPLGRPLTGPERDDYIHGWKNKVNGMTQDQKDISFILNARHDPVFRQWIELESQLRQKQQEGAQTLELRLDDKDNPSNAYRTLEYRPERDGVPSIQKAIQYADEPAKDVKTGNILERTAHVYDPQDLSMRELLRFAVNKVTGYANKGLGKDSDIHGKDGNRVAGARDESYAEAERQAGRAVTGYVNKALAPKNPVHGEDGSRPVSEPDQTTGKLIPAIFQNMDNETVGRAIQEFNEAQGYTYDPKHGSRQAYSFEKGMKMAPLEAKTAFYSFASLMGEMVYGMTGGDPKALRAVQDTLKTYQREMDAMKPMTPEKIIDPNDPEKTLQNVTDYLYQNLGNQIVKIPVTALLGKVDSLATLTGMSAASVSANLHAKLLDKTGQAHVGESLMYGIPLGMLSLLNIPFQPPAQVRSPEELKRWVTSVLADFGVGQGQEAGAKYVADGYSNRKTEDKKRSQR